MAIYKNYHQHQIINTLTHIPNLVLIIYLHLNLIPECSSLFHYEIIYAKIDLKVYYPTPYEGLTWNYSKVNITTIRKGISHINWTEFVENLNINDQVQYLSNCILNRFTNFVPNKKICM